VKAKERKSKEEVVAKEKRSGKMTP